MAIFKCKFNKIEITVLTIVGTVASILLVNVFAMGIHAWVNRPVICSTKDGRKVYELLDQVSAKWDDERKLASNTSRMNLPARISELQSVRRDVEKQEWPGCAEKAKGELLKGMNYTIDGFIEFLDSDKPEVFAISKLTLGESSFTIFKGELEKLKVPQKIK